MFGHIHISVSVKDVVLIARNCKLAVEPYFDRGTPTYYAAVAHISLQKHCLRKRFSQISAVSNLSANLFSSSKKRSFSYSFSGYGTGFPIIIAECRLNYSVHRAVFVDALRRETFKGELLDVLRMAESRSSCCRARSVGMGNSMCANVEQHADLDCLSTADTTSLSGISSHPLRDVGKSTNIVWQECMVKKDDREKHLRQKGCVIWITGLSGSGKSTLACTLDHALLRRGRLSYVLDGDNLRHGLNNNLGFSAEDRTENIRRVGEVARLFADAGLICIASFISPYRKDREACRKLLPPGDFIEVYLKVPLELCERRDAKGLYKLARAGKIKCFTGIDDPYEEPHTCEIVLEPIDGFLASPEEMAAHVISFLEKRGYLQASN